MNNHLATLLATLALAGCGGTEYVEDGTACDKAYCSDRGTCAFTDTHPACTCDKGYAGLVCSRCDTGYHRGADHACVADETCTPGVCGDHGVCAIVLGTVSCACEAGYGGLDCKACRSGFHTGSDGTCVLDEGCFPTTCSGGGTCSVQEGHPVCACESARAGTFCEERHATCEGNTSCGDHGECVAQDGVVRCACEPGWGGPTCGSCYPGFRSTEEGKCELSDSCLPSTCHFAGTCALSSGAATCACSAGYTGDTCDACATGYHRDATYACAADEACTAGRCGSNGQCRVSGGRAVCDCHDGYAGAACDKCHPGYHRDADGACALDEACRPDSCRFHGTCDDATGSVACTCEPGFEGKFCESNIDDCVNSACGTGICVDLLDANACLCADHTWGPSCL